MLAQDLLQEPRVSHRRRHGVVAPRHDDAAAAQRRRCSSAVAGADLYTNAMLRVGGSWRGFISATAAVKDTGFLAVRPNALRVRWLLGSNIFCPTSR